MYLSRRAQRLLNLIEWFSETCQHIFPSQRALAGYLKCSVRTVKRALAELRGHLVGVRRRYRRSNVYRLLEAEPDPQLTFSFDASNEGEKQEVLDSKPIVLNKRVPIAVPTVVERNSETKSQAVPKAKSSEGYQYPPREDAERSTDVELKRLAGLPGPVLGGERAFLRDLEARAVPLDVIRGGIALGTARKLVQISGERVAGVSWEPVRSLRYFAGSILEAATLPMSYLQHVEGFIRRHRKPAGKETASIRREGVR